MKSHAYYLLTLYILETSLFLNSKWDLLRGSEIHTYTLLRNNYHNRDTRWQFMSFCPLRQEFILSINYQILKKLPKTIKALISKEFYSAVNFIAHNGYHDWLADNGKEGKIRVNENCYVFKHDLVLLNGTKFQLKFSINE